jgi:hypothetical protein
LKGRHKRQVLLIFDYFIAVDQLTGQPEEPETEQNTHKRGQMRQGLEHRNGTQDADPREEHETLFK